MDKESFPSHGVESLIEKLRAQGVEAGRREAEQILAAARQEAETLLQQAKAQAEQIVEQARATQQRLEHAAREALALAVRDAKLKLRQEFADALDRKLAELVQKALDPLPFLQQLILQLAGQVGQALSAENLTLVLPESAKELTLGVFKETLREGVRLRPGIGQRAGIRVELGEEVVVDLSEEAIKAWLWTHLRPKFRQLLEGIDDA